MLGSLLQPDRFQIMPTLTQRVISENSQEQEATDGASDIESSSKW